MALLSKADQALGRLDGIGQTIPNPDLFVAMFVRREAVLSSQIEGTQSTLEDVLAFEVDPNRPKTPRDVKEVVNYVRAMNRGMTRLQTLPLSLRLIREIHEELMQGVRGASRRPGEFRDSQNWIGPEGAPITQATFVPPPVKEMHQALNDLERFMHEERVLPILIHCALVHAQFETIHPFHDGNGRVGRLLVTFLLVMRGALSRPILYLSHYLKQHRLEYYDRLMAVRDGGDWEGWLRFFLNGVGVTAEEAARTARGIGTLRQRHMNLLEENGLGLNALRLLDLLYQRPIVSVGLVQDHLGITFRSAGKLIERLQKLDVLSEITGGKRNRLFRYAAYVDLFEEKEESTAIASASSSY